MNEIILSTLGHTWILDLDGTILKHNGYLLDGTDSFLPGAKQFLNSIPEKDMIVFITSREEKYREITECFLKQNRIRFAYIIFNAPYGERIVINDNKPSGLNMCKAISLKRNSNFSLIIKEEESL